METFDQFEEQKKNEQRPTFLSVLCVLSFISIGFGLLSGILGLFLGPMSEELILQQKVQWVKMADELRSVGADGFAKMIEQFERMMDSLNANHYANSAVTILIRIIAFFGVLLMWKGKKLGFHLYIVYSLIAIMQIYFFVAPADIPTLTILVNIVIAALFVFMYSRNLKWLS